MYLPVKVVMNKEKTKVLFAEATTDFVDVLLSFLMLPLGRIVTLDEAAPVVGSLNSLHAGLSNLDDTYFSSRGAKRMLLNPRSALAPKCRKLAFDISDSRNRYFLCPARCQHAESSNISLDADVATCKCGRSLDREILVQESPDGGGFTVDPLSFIVTGDLRVAPIVVGVFETLINLGFTDTRGSETQILSFGIDEIRDLLKLSMTSADPLTDMIIKKTHTTTFIAGEPKLLIPKQKSNSRKITLKVCLQKSTNKFLFAEDDEEFLDLLFGFLTLPLGQVEFLLGGNSGLKNIDNLYRSVTHGIDDKCFKNPKTKKEIINPKLPHGCISKKQFLPLSEEAPPKLFYHSKRESQFEPRHSYTFYENNVYFYLHRVRSFKLNKELYVKKRTMCFVADDLTVSPGLVSSLSILNGLGIPLSDVTEMELHIGLQEALCILKASLISKTAMTDGLINPMLEKMQNQSSNT